MIKFIYTILIPLHMSSKQEFLDYLVEQAKLDDVKKIVVIKSVHSDAVVSHYKQSIGSTRFQM